MQALHLLRELRDAFAKHDSRGEVTTTRESVASASTDLRIGALPGSPAFSVMVRTEALGEQPPRAVLQLHEAPSGKLLAVMNATHLAALRSALVGALATDVLAREQAADVAVLGSGAAASGALKALRLVRALTGCGCTSLTSPRTSSLR